MIYTINNCIRAFGYTNFDKLIADMGSVDNLREYVRANGYADIAVAEDTELLLVDVNGKTWHTGCYGAKLGPEPDYLCFTSNGDSTISMSQYGTPNTSANKVIQYKLNNGQWQTWDLSEVPLSVGDKMYVKSDDEVPISETAHIYKKFVMTGNIAASGNIMSLLNFSDTLTDYAFFRLFDNCTALAQAPTLPATTLAQHCYSSMFYYCMSITQAPELPATTLAQGCYSDMFQACTSLTTTPELPATSLGEACYANMFSGCTSLTHAQALPATTLNNECYAAMFSGCTSLVQAPELPAIELKYRCYKQMFNSCTSLTTAPALPATILAEECYNEMFQRCTSLVQAPALPATILGSYCCSYMFNGCTALTQAPALHATTLAQGCYAEMFMNCTSLVQAPELLAATLAPYCYVEMFSGCSNLNYVKAMFTDVPSEGNPVGSWLNNVSPTGTFIKSKDATWSNTDANIPSGWTVQVEGGVTPEPEPERDYLCFTSTGDSTVAMTQNGTPTDISKNKVIQYKLNNGQWQTWDLSAVTLHDGDKMYLKSDDEIPISESDSIYKQFTMTGSIAASGNTMSLLNFSDTLTDYAFTNLFKNCTSLTAAPELPATVLGQDCYNYMFYGCTSLVTAPALPATTLALNCYNSMFQECSSLTTAPALPATTLTINCYSGMFAYCSSLVQAPELPATTLMPDCYTSMFTACTSLTTAPALPATTLVMSCYGSMFSWCSSLVQAPELPATTLEYGCYNYMFQGCTKLNYVKALFTTDPTTTEYLSGWLNGVSETGTFVKNSTATWTNEQAGIPTGWTVQTASPDK